MKQFYKRYAYVCVFAFIMLFSLNTSYSQWKPVSSSFPIGYTLTSQQAQLDEKLYVFGGSSPNGDVANSWVFDTKNASAGWQAIADLPAPRSGGYAATVDGKIYILGGMYRNSSNAIVNQTAVLEYDPSTDSYTEKADIITPVYNTAGAVVGKRIFLLNGLSGTTYSKQAQVYDVEKNAWEELADTRYNSAYSTAVAIGETIYLIGGFNGSAALNVMYKGEVNSTSNEIAWTKLSNIPQAVLFGASGTDGTNIFLAGGVNSTLQSTLNTVYKFDVAKNKWSSTYMLPYSLQVNTNMPNIGNKLYLISGYGFGGTLEFTEGTPVAILNRNTDKFDYFLKVNEEKIANLYMQNAGVVPLTGTMSVDNSVKWLTVPTDYEIAPSEVSSFELVVNSTGLSEGTHTTTVKVTSNSDNVKNFDMTITVFVINSGVKRKPLIEVFTSSTCGPCRPGNQAVDNTLSEFLPSDYSIVKFQQDFPSTGDPYTTNETLTRRNFYGINGIPAVRIDGQDIGGVPTSASFNTETIIAAQEAPGFVNLESSYSVSGRKVNVNVDISSPITINSENIRLMIAISEKETKKNVKTNGETVFHHVVKKMLPDANGTQITEIKPGEKIHKTFEFEFPGNYRLPKDGQRANIINTDTEHSVEDFEDLEVVVWMDNVVASFGLGSTPSSIVSSVEELPDNSGLSMIDICPNPSAGLTTFRFNAEKKMNVTLELFDLAGNKVTSIFNGSVVPGEHSAQFDTSVLSSGQYTMWLKTNDKFIGRTINVTK